MKKKKTRKGRYKRGEYTSIKSNEVYKFRSGWERAYMEYLDLNEDVTSWSYESFNIEYVSNIKTKKIRKYIPDFKVEYSNGSIEIVEIKPLKKLNQVLVKKKINAAQAWCDAHGFIFRIITETELKNASLI
jgi:hypothetical protein